MSVYSDSDSGTDWEVLPLKFQQSMTDRPLYPQNLLHRTIYTCTAGKRSAWDRLHEAEKYLFQNGKNEDDLDVRFREYGRDIPGDMDKQNVRSLRRLVEWLGIDEFDTELLQRIVRSERRDPQSRFIYIYGDSSRSRLNITKEMLLLVLTFHQVMPAYLEFMLVFGERKEQPDERFSGFKVQKLLRASSLSASLAVPALGRSGRHYQMCYNLKCVDLKAWREDALVNDSDYANSTLKEWSIRQAAFHHQFDVVEGKALWIVTKGGEDLQQRYKEMTAGDSRPEDRTFGTPAEGFQSTLAVHLMFCFWALQDWVGYVRWLEEVVNAKSLMAVIGPRGQSDSHQTYESTDVQNLQHWEERAQLATDVLIGNADVMEHLHRFYTDLATNTDFPMKDGCSDSIDEFTSEVQDMINTLRMQVTRVQGLARLIRDRRQLVTQHLQSQAAERMEALSSSMEKEAIVVRIITIVTLVYLPATFVSTFFSTDVVKYQNQEDGTDPEGTFSDTAMARWLQVALPLTFITLLFAWCAKNWAERHNLREKYRSREPAPTPEPRARSDPEKCTPKPGISPASTASNAASWWAKVAARRAREPCCELPSHNV